MYNVLIDRRTLTMLIVGLSLIGLLLFFGGYLTGLHSQIAQAAPGSSGAASSPAAQSAPASAASSQAVAPQAADASDPGVQDTPPPPSAVRPPLDSIRTGDQAAAQQGVGTGSGASAAGSASADGQAAASADGQNGSQGMDATGVDGAPGDMAPPAAAETSTAPAGATSAAAGGSADTGADAAQSPPPAGNFTLQVGAYFVEEHLSEALEQLEALGYSPFVVTVKDANDRDVYTVRLGPYPTRDEAEAAEADFEAKEDLSAFIRSE